MRGLVIAFLPLLLVGAGACGGSASRRTDASLCPDVPHFVRPGAPHPLACATDDDCVPAAGVNPAEGCCTTIVPTSIASRDYVAWHAAWAKQRCAAVRCPPLPPPAPLLPCAQVGRCVAGRCTDRCGGR